MELKHEQTSAYHPQCNSQVEVGNKAIAKYLRNVVDATTLNWEMSLPPLMFFLHHAVSQNNSNFTVFFDIWSTCKTS